MPQIDLDQAKERFVEILKRVASGEEFVIAKDDQPLAKIIGIAKRKADRQFGSAKGMIKLSKDFDEL